MAKTIWTLDLEGSPWSEDCAQVGHTPNFDLVNTAEAMLHRAALIAVAGSPPAGITLRIKANAHDFGTYRTVEARIDDEQDDGSHASYLETLEAGIAFWHQAGFALPEFGKLTASDQLAGFVVEAVASALRITRPSSTGTFFPESSGPIHRNLTAAFPEAAQRAFPEGAVPC
ncbi:MAG: hypothetical protein ACT6Q7_20595 [Blastomonas fulva]|uniref:hypothetical protein n=1 Tax=Alphaproteobacteria TaxID=28211 RepID=UPI0040338B2F